MNKDRSWIGALVVAFMFLGMIIVQQCHMKKVERRVADNTANIVIAFNAVEERVFKIERNLSVIYSDSATRELDSLVIFVRNLEVEMRAMTSVSLQYLLRLSSLRETLEMVRDGRRLEKHWDERHETHESHLAGN